MLTKQRKYNMIKKENNNEKDMSKEPIFRLPPFEVQKVFVGLSETQDWGLRLLNIP